MKIKEFNKYTESAKGRDLFPDISAYPKAMANKSRGLPRVPGQSGGHMTPVQDGGSKRSSCSTSVVVGM